MAARRPPSPSPRGLLILLVMAVGFGILAGLLAHGVSTGPTAPTSHGPSYFDTGAFWFSFLGYVSFGLFFGYVAYEVWRRIRGGRMPVPALWAVSMLMVLLIGIAFVFLFQWVGGSVGPAGHNTTASPPNSSAGRGTPPPVGHNNSTGGLRPGPLPGLPQVSWAVLGLVGVLVAAAVAVAVLYRLRNAEPREPEGDPVAERVRAELVASLRRLEDDPQADPREVILALYHRLLLRIRRRLGPLGQYTPREIEQVIVAYYGARDDHARELRELFEVARYSTHPLGRPEADRARAALRGLLDDLDAWTERERERRERAAARAEAPHPPV
jgi:hypothetical protein